MNRAIAIRTIRTENDWTHPVFGQFDLINDMRCQISGLLGYSASANEFTTVIRHIAAGWPQAPCTIVWMCSPPIKDIETGGFLVKSYD